MINLPFFPKDLARVDLAGYPRRLENGVGALSRACGLDVELEARRFRTCRDHLGVSPALGPAPDMMAQLRRAVVSGAPLIFELVATFSGDGLKGFGYLTQGRPTGTLPVNLGALLSGALELHLTSGGSTDEAMLLADVFRLSFPNLSGLAEFSSLSQGMIVGVVPQGDRLTLKVYFNTRLDPSGNHQERVAAILKRCGLDDHGAYDLLYAKNDGARFHGVGVDLDGDSKCRAKLYVRLTEAQLCPTLTALASHLQPDVSLAVQAILAPVWGMLDAMRGRALVDDMELAVALHTDAAPTAKVTLFWASELVTAAEQRQLESYLNSLGYPGGALSEAIDALGENAQRAVSQKHPFHGLGIEVPVGGRPKINVYLQPVL